MERTNVSSIIALAMEVINALHEKVCSIERDWHKLQDERDAQAEKLQELHEYKENCLKRIVKQKSIISNTKEDLVIAKDELNNILTESSSLDVLLERQERQLQILPNLAHNYCTEYGEYCSEMRQEVKRLYEDMARVKGYSTKMNDLLHILHQNQSSWKLRESQRQAYRDMMIKKLKDGLGRETTELGNLLSQLQSIKNRPQMIHNLPPQPSIIPAQEYYNSMSNGQNNTMMIGSHGNIRHPPTMIAPQSTVEADAQSHLPTSNERMPEDTEDSQVPKADEVIEIDTSDYHTVNVVTPDERSIESIGAASFTATRATLLNEQTNTMISIESYEMSVSPWFHDRKRRRIDVYSLQDSMNLS